jgi:O-antigen ligase
VGVLATLLVGAAALGYAVACTLAGDGLRPVVVPLARDVLLVATAAAVAWRARRSDDVRWFLSAAFVGAAIYGLTRTSPDLPDSHAIWKYGSGIPVLLLGAAVLGGLRLRRTRVAIYAWLLAMAGVSTLLDYRSLAFVAVAAAALIAVFARPRPVTRTIALAVCIGVVVGSAALAYPAAADRGWLGTEAQDKYRLQNSQSGDTFGPLSLLGVARSTTFTSAALVAEKPFIGHGAHPTLWVSTALRAARWSNNFGVRQPTGDLVVTWYTIAEHSLLFEAWVRGGLLAALLFMFVVAVLVWLATRGWHRSALVPLGTTAACLGIWDVLFSPVAPSTLLSLATALGIASALSRRRGEVDSQRQSSRHTRAEGRAAADVVT